MDYILAILGGLLIGGASALLLLFNGRIAGVSGIFGQLLERDNRDASWRVTFLLGMAAAGVIYFFIDPSVLTQTSAATPLVLVGSGLLVGVGTAMSNGCTSGHGVAGLARRSKRSLVATLTFVGTAAATVFVTHHVLGVL